MARARPFSLEEARIAWIRRLESRTTARRVPVGIGDDAALYRARPGWDVVATVDAQAEGTHFERDWLSFAELGARAVSASVSDLAAMAATGGALLVSILLSDDVSEPEFRALARGIHDAARRYDTPIIGGNLSRGPLSVSVTSLGEVERGRAILRHGASPGDELWVTGSPGLARLGLLALSGEAPALRQSDAVRAWRRPQARLNEARWLARRWPITALIDLSDGLGRDLSHLAEDASGKPRIGFEIDRARLEELEPTSRLARKAGLDPALVALAGGEDYELCFTSRPRSRALESARRFVARFGVALERIGTAVEQPGIAFVDASGRRTPVRADTFEHFARVARDDRVDQDETGARSRANDQPSSDETSKRRR